MFGHHPMIDLISSDSAHLHPGVSEAQYRTPADTRNRRRTLMRAWRLRLALFWFGLGGVSACGEERRIEFCDVELPPGVRGSCDPGGAGGGGSGTGGAAAGRSGAGGAGGALGLGGSGGVAGSLAGGGGTNGLPPGDASVPTDDAGSDGGDPADAAATP
jgi:hypothetical protein